MKMNGELVVIAWPQSESGVPGAETVHLVHTSGDETLEDLQAAVDAVVASHPDCIVRRLPVIVTGDPAALLGSECRVESIESFPLNVVVVQTDRDAELD